MVSGSSRGCQTAIRACARAAPGTSAPQHVTMVKRQTFTEAQLPRSVKLADKHGKIAVQTHIVIAFVAPALITHIVPAETAVDDWFGENLQNHVERH